MLHYIGLIATTWITTENKTDVTASATVGRNYCSIVSGDVSSCSYRLSVRTLTDSYFSSAYQLFCRGKTPKHYPAYRVALTSVQLNELATSRKGAVTTVTVDRQRPVRTVTI